MSTATPVCVEIKGELNIFTAAGLRQQLLDAFATGAGLDVDLAQVSEMDCAGLQVMLAARREAATRKLILHFVRPSPAVREVLACSNLAELLGDAMPIQTLS